MATAYDDPGVFGADNFRKSYRMSLSADPAMKQVFMWQLTQFHELYRAIGPSLTAAGQQCRILEYGGGPACVYPLISAASYASEIVFAEYAEQNRKATEQWRSKSSEAFDLSDQFQYVVGTLEGCVDETCAQEREENLRSLISDVVPCDITNSEALSANVILPFDIVSTHFCLPCACKSIDEYSICLQKLARLLRPGGMIVLTDAVGESFYTAGSVRIPYLYFHSSDVVHQALLKAMFTDVSVHSLTHLPTELTDSKEVVFCTGVTSTL